MTYGIMPYGGAPPAGATRWCWRHAGRACCLLVAFVVVESAWPSRCSIWTLFRIRAFSMGCAAQLLSALAYGGFQFALIVWLQGIWLPLHGYAFEDTPVWAAIY